jgi:hypothetical protein
MLGSFTTTAPNKKKYKKHTGTSLFEVKPLENATTWHIDTFIE